MAFILPVNLRFIFRSLQPFFICFFSIGRKLLRQKLPRDGGSSPALRAGRCLKRVRSAQGADHPARLKIRGYRRTRA